MIVLGAYTPFALACLGLVRFYSPYIATAVVCAGFLIQLLAFFGAKHETEKATLQRLELKVALTGFLKSGPAK